MAQKQFEFILFFQMIFMKLELDFSKSLEENAAAFFEKSKKAKKKLAGMASAKTDMEKRLLAEREKSAVLVQKRVPQKRRKKDWFEKFRWFFSTDGFLVLGGHDAKQNEQLVKKFFEPADLFFHADIFGAPHCILKSSGKSVPESSRNQAAQFAAVFSKAWESGIGKVDVYSAEFDQVSKAAPSGEAIGKGAFMVYGKREWFRGVPMVFSVGIEPVESSFRINSGPREALAKRCSVWFEIAPGDHEKSKIAKHLFSLFEKKTSQTLSKMLLDELLAMLPNGKTRVVLKE